MPLSITDEMLQQAGLSEDEARIEIACRLFDADRLTLHQAACWAGLDRFGMESVLMDRRIPVYRFTEEDLAIELAGLRSTDKAL